MKQQELEKSKEYKYGFTTDIESIRAPKGLNEEVIRFISKIKKEPEWMLNWRLKAYSRLKSVKEPNWQKPKYPKIDYSKTYIIILLLKVLKTNQKVLMRLIPNY